MFSDGASGKNDVGADTAKQNISGAKEWTEAIVAEDETEEEGQSGKNKPTPAKPPKDPSNSTLSHNAAKFYPPGYVPPHLQPMASSTSSAMSFASSGSSSSATSTIGITLGSSFAKQQTSTDNVSNVSHEGSRGYSNAYLANPDGSTDGGSYADDDGDSAVTAGTDVESNFSLDADTLSPEQIGQYKQRLLAIAALDVTQYTDEIHQEAEEIFKKLRKIDLKNFKNIGGKNLLHYAVAKNNVKFVQLCLKAKIDFNQQDINGKTPVQFAIDKDHTEILQVILFHIVSNFYKLFRRKIALNLDLVNQIVAAIKIKKNINDVKNERDETLANIITFNDKKGLCMTLWNAGVVIPDDILQKQKPFVPTSPLRSPTSDRLSMQHPSQSRLLDSIMPALLSSAIDEKPSLTTALAHRNVDAVVQALVDGQDFRQLLDVLENDNEQDQEFLIQVAFELIENHYLGEKDVSEQEACELNNFKAICNKLKQMEIILKEIVRVDEEELNPTLLHEAARAGKDQLVLYMITSENITAELQDEQEKTALDYSKAAFDELMQDPERTKLEDHFLNNHQRIELLLKAQKSVEKQDSYISDASPFFRIPAQPLARHRSGETETKPEPTAATNTSSRKDTNLALQMDLHDLYTSNQNLHLDLDSIIARIFYLKNNIKNNFIYDKKTEVIVSNGNGLVNYYYMLFIINAFNASDKSKNSSQMQLLLSLTDTTNEFMPALSALENNFNDTDANVLANVLLKLKLVDQYFAEPTLMADRTQFDTFWQALPAQEKLKLELAQKAAAPQTAARKPSAKAAPAAPAPLSSFSSSITAGKSVGQGVSDNNPRRGSKAAKRVAITENLGSASTSAASAPAVTTPEPPPVKPTGRSWSSIVQGGPR